MTFAFSVCLISFSLMLSRSVQAVTNDEVFQSQEGGLFVSVPDEKSHRHATVNILLYEGEKCDADYHLQPG